MQHIVISGKFGVSYSFYLHIAIYSHPYNIWHLAYLLSIYCNISPSIQYLASCIVFIYILQYIAIRTKFGNFYFRIIKIRILHNETLDIKKNSSILNVYLMECYGN